jgi:hypothetical protein
VFVCPVWRLVNEMDLFVFEYVVTVKYILTLSYPTSAHYNFCRYPSVHPKVQLKVGRVSGR